MDKPVWLLGKPLPGWRLEERERLIVGAGLGAMLYPWCALSTVAAWLAMPVAREMLRNSLLTILAAFDQPQDWRVQSLGAQTWRRLQKSQRKLTPAIDLHDQPE